MLLSKVTSQMSPPSRASLGLALTQKEHSASIGMFADRGGIQGGSKQGSPTPRFRSGPGGKKRRRPTRLDATGVSFDLSNDLPSSQFEKLQIATQGLALRKAGSLWQSQLQVNTKDGDGIGVVTNQIPEQLEETSSVGSFFDVPQAAQEVSLHQQIMRKFAARKPFIRSTFYNELTALEQKMDLFNEFEANQKKTFKLGEKTKQLLAQGQKTHNITKQAEIEENVTSRASELSYIEKLKTQKQLSRKLTKLMSTKLGASFARSSPFKSMMKCTASDAESAEKLQILDRDKRN